MPIYEYECPKCGRFDALQKMSDPALSRHDVCGSKVKKLISASAFAFKGSGFYITDYNGRNAAAITGKGDKESRSGSGESKAEKSESKPESRSEPKSENKAPAKPKASAA